MGLTALCSMAGVITIKDFSANLFQKDLAQAYTTKEFVAKLPFSLGYHWNSGNQNEMVAIKK